jgi:hypothetical protein
MTRSAVTCFFHLFLGIIAPLDESLGNLMSTLHENIFREVHECAVQLALRPSGIGEVGVDD